MPCQSRDVKTAEIKLVGLWGLCMLQAIGYLCCNNPTGCNIYFFLSEYSNTLHLVPTNPHTTLQTIEGDIKEKYFIPYNKTQHRNF
jgi:hypothetical protein